MAQKNKNKHQAKKAAPKPQESGTVKVKILKSCAGDHPVTGKGFSFVANEVVNVDKELAAGLGGLASPVV